VRTSPANAANAYGRTATPTGRSSLNWVR
jgi:hypothetical protein